MPEKKSRYNKREYRSKHPKPQAGYSSPGWTGGPEFNPIFPETVLKPVVDLLGTVGKESLGKAIAEYLAAAKENFDGPKDAEVRAALEGLDASIKDLSGRLFVACDQSGKPTAGLDERTARALIDAIDRALAEKANGFGTNGADDISHFTDLKRRIDKNMRMLQCLVALALEDYRDLSASRPASQIDQILLSKLDALFRQRGLTASAELQSQFMSVVCPLFNWLDGLEHAAGHRTSVRQTKAIETLVKKFLASLDCQWV